MGEFSYHSLPKTRGAWYGNFALSGAYPPKPLLKDRLWWRKRAVIHISESQG
jgi:hypothetical protein